MKDDNSNGFTDVYRLDEGTIFAEIRSLLPVLFTTVKLSCRTETEIS